jgi:hypothetical protein
VVSAVFLALIAMQGCQGCPSVTLKTVDLPVTSSPTGRSGLSGSKGFCIVAGQPPPSPFSAGPGQILVGFDDYFKKGTEPFPCDDVRNAIFRGGLLFNLGPFDSIVSASLLFDAAASVLRQGGGSVGTIPGKSFATTLGVATQAFSSKMLDDNVVSLGTSANTDIGVTSQVKDWIEKARPNFGFVVGGPRFAGGVFEDNDAQLTWYSNFRLRVVYNPAQNPRAPQ